MQSLFVLIDGYLLERNISLHTEDTKDDWTKQFSKLVAETPFVAHIREVRWGWIELENGRLEAYLVTHEDVSMCLISSQSVLML